MRSTAPVNKRVIRAMRKWWAAGRRYDTSEYTKVSYLMEQNSERYGRYINRISQER